ncbi:galactose-3-O-sulfotransferase 3 isoform X4 [Hydra vulgaris]|uniref:Galactose-3-O-sulfotransferase 3 isoform X4 n=1 Tax=Hydra vulgaris TaxID=6087 RepID=A0ABM4DA24_HYDVU
MPGRSNLVKLTPNPKWYLLIILVFWSVLMIISDLSKLPLNPRKKRQCTPGENVIFLKTHKTGSTTVANIMYRYSISNRLKVALPRCGHRFCFPLKFKHNFLYKHTENETYNMLFHHAVYDKQNMLKIFDKGQTKLVTILREPYSQFDSAAQYLKFRKYYKLNGTLPVLDELFKLSNKELEKYIRSQKFDGFGTYSLTKNPNAFDMGFDPWNETNEYINRILKTIENDFNLIMITEYMEESLILLKNELCWNIKDVAFFHHNARLTKDVNTNNLKKAKSRLMNWNKIDVAIYNYFNQTFWRRIENSGSNFKQDVEKLKRLNNLLKITCSSQQNSETTATKAILKSDFDIVQNITELCFNLLIEEQNFTNYLKQAKDKKL